MGCAPSGGVLYVFDEINEAKHLELYVPDFYNVTVAMLKVRLLSLVNRQKYTPTFYFDLYANGLLRDNDSLYEADLRHMSIVIICTSLL